MISALFLALGQLGDGPVLRVLAKSILVTLLLFAGFAALGLWAGQHFLAASGLGDDLSQLGAILAVIALGWLLWRVLALAVLQFFADEVVAAVERKHYPAIAASARALGWREELGHGLRSAARAIGLNLIALPVALILLVTGIGAPLVFWLVNALLLGRELIELVWLRHAPSRRKDLPLSGSQRFIFGGLIAALLMLPFVNLLAPLVGAAMATHLVHRKASTRDEF